MAFWGYHRAVKLTSSGPALGVLLFGSSRGSGNRARGYYWEAPPPGTMPAGSLSQGAYLDARET